MGRERCENGQTPERSVAVFDWLIPVAIIVVVVWWIYDYIYGDDDGDGPDDGNSSTLGGNGDFDGGE